MCDFVKEIKVQSNEFINEKKWVHGHFQWQTGYGVFSYGHLKSQGLQIVLNQEEHHKKKTFKEEYYELLKKFSVSFKERYLFEWIE